ncbi:MAG: helix-turn-helix domain-containing protein [Acidimicrobiales bacterium]
MDSLSLARSMRGSIGMLAMHWLMAPVTNEKAVAAGMPEGIPGYAVGRLGVLGDCPVDNVVGAAFFWEPEYMAAQVRAGRAEMSPHEGAGIFARLCQEWGETHLDGFDGTERLGELAQRVVDAASPMNAPTFVGWRDQELPEPGPARTMQLAQTMRELGFARFCTAVQASGMSPLDAIMSGPTGAWNAKFFGWPEPYPDGAPNVDARNEIEGMANRLHAPDFDVLSDDERDEFKALAKAARDHAGSKMSADSGAALPKD